MKQRLAEIVDATRGAVTADAAAPLTGDAGRGVRILEALVHTLGPHTVDDLKRIAQGGGRVAPGVIIKDLAEALEVALRTH